MKKLIFPIILFLISSFLLYSVINKVYLIDYNKNEQDKDTYYLLQGTYKILDELYIEEQKLWGKNEDSRAATYTYKYINSNINELSNKLKLRESDLYNLKASLVLTNLSNLYQLKDMVGKDQKSFKIKYDIITKKIKYNLKELKEMV
ncbi:MAG: hypothetical protein RR659_01250 [Bacilli bacterium]